MDDNVSNSAPILALNFVASDKTHLLLRCKFRRLIECIIFKPYRFLRTFNDKVTVFPCENELLGTIHGVLFGDIMTSPQLVIEPLFSKKIVSLWEDATINPVILMHFYSWSAYLAIYFRFCSFRIRIFESETNWGSIWSFV